MSHPLLDITQLHALSQPPAPFTPGEPLFWNDPHISKGMLTAHLDPDTEAASRHPDTIDAIVDHLLAFLGLEPGAAWLDIGCGPGLYTARLARRGLRVTGMDYSQRSIAYAREYAAAHDVPIDYRYQNYLTLDEGPEYDVISLIYGDFCPLSPAQRDNLLARVRRALKPGGVFVFDASTPALRARHRVRPNWYAAPEGGFWRPGPHLVLERGFTYPGDITLDQFVVIEPDGTLTIYRNWFQDYTRATLTQVIEAAGFSVRACWNDLAGTPYAPGGEWLGVVTAPA